MPVTAVIGDIHGCIRTLDKLINSIEKRFSSIEYISLGDIIDRGPGICEVSQLFMDMKKRGILQMVRGNHEDVLIDFYHQTHGYDYTNWMHYGGRETLECLSGGKLSRQLAVGEIPVNDFKKYADPYMDFFESADYKLSRIFRNNKFMFSHAGIGPSHGKAFSVFEFKKRKNYLFMWSRDTWKSDKKYYGYTQVHGHTPVAEVDVHHDPHTPFVNRNKKGELVSIALDTGCVYGYSLSAMLVDDYGDFEFISERNAE